MEVVCYIVGDGYLQSWTSTLNKKEIPLTLTTELSRKIKHQYMDLNRQRNDKQMSLHLKAYLRNMVVDLGKVSIIQRRRKVIWKLKCSENISQVLEGLGKKGVRWIRKSYHNLYVLNGMDHMWWLGCRFSFVFICVLFRPFFLVCFLLSYK